jgi:hypothetical protein
MSFSYVFVLAEVGSVRRCLVKQLSYRESKGTPEDRERRIESVLHLKLRIEDKMRNGYESGIGMGIILSKQYKEEKKQTYDEKLGHQVLVEGQQ